MAEPPRQPWLTRQLEAALRRGLSHGYNSIRVDPEKFLMELRAAHGLPISGFSGVFSIPVERIDQLARSTIQAGRKIAAVEGAGFSLAGGITLVPDLSILAVITLRTIQKLSLLYGFEFNTDQEMAELWIAAASAAGVDISRELLEKEVLNRFIPRVIQRIALETSTEMMEKWAGRMIPVASSLLGAGLNYYFVGAWGRRAQAHFRAKHLIFRQHRAEPYFGEAPQLAARLTS